jgi:hypothetical protein
MTAKQDQMTFISAFLAGMHAKKRILRSTNPRSRAGAITSLTGRVFSPRAALGAHVVLHAIIDRQRIVGARQA